MPTSPPCSRTAAIVSAAGMPGRNGLSQENGDQVAVAGADLFPDEDREVVRRDISRPERAVDPVVVGDGEMCQAPSDGGGHDALRRGERVETRGRVAMEVHERPGRGHRPERRYRDWTSDFLKKP